MKKPLVNSPGPSLMFHMPYVQPKLFRPGRQPFNPGESQIDSGNPHFNQIPWPNSVPSLVALANNAGTARSQALQISNNANANGMNNYLFIGGFAGKSRG